MILINCDIADERKYFAYAFAFVFSLLKNLVYKEAAVLFRGLFHFQ